MGFYASLQGWGGPAKFNAIRWLDHCFFQNTHISPFDTSRDPLLISKWLLATSMAACFFPLWSNTRTLRMKKGGKQWLRMQPMQSRKARLSLRKRMSSRKSLTLCVFQYVLSCFWLIHKTSGDNSLYQRDCKEGHCPSGLGAQAQAQTQKGEKGIHNPGRHKTALSHSCW